MLNALKRLGIGFLLWGVTGAGFSDVVVVMSAQSPSTSINREELADIYLGRLNQLPNGAQVIPLDQTERSPLYEEFYQGYLGRTPAQIKAHWSRLIFTGRGQPPQSVPDDKAMIEAIANNPRAIGYIDSENVSENLRVLNIE
ncbi:type 2 periplasmic-binding domain-containing protein [Bowmanella dokdonensis]|uniref:Phosphate ABC transporter substrate-binding protein n=1 Tax=Bowmanella dokdonensis TaxID=751969 RepID=A0A939IRC5_9ALTE|nr:phosphate ABC transporter substrate-binding protein [Bowmanella dokdonensis]MBN7825361.1 phosphate ABC transporter substrate-binding protein [Bowmanella dokdonensis]